MSSSPSSLNESSPGGSRDQQPSWSSLVEDKLFDCGENAQMEDHHNNNNVKITQLTQLLQSGEPSPGDSSYDNEHFLALCPRSRTTSAYHVLREISIL